MSNIESQNGLVMAEKVMIDLVGKGVARDEAHEILRTASFRAVETGEHLKQICLKTEKLMEKVSKFSIFCHCIFDILLCSVGLFFVSCIL